MSRELTSIERARELVLERTAPLPPEGVELREATGRVLAESVSAGEDIPGFDNSALDGYAVRADDTAAPPVELLVVGESRAGHPADRAVGEGEAIAISTGAVMPGGADAVVRVEDTSRSGERVRVEASVEDGAAVRRAGEDVRAGAHLLEAGTRLGAAEIGALAAAGRARVECAREPRLAIVVTGDELVEPGTPLGPGQIRNSNAYALPPLAEAAGARVVGVGAAGDDREATRDALAEALEAADVLVVSGGVSVGEHDHVRPALDSLGVEQVFWGVSLRPGKPTYFGTAAGDGALAFGLPGNPVSAMVTFLLFVRPALLAMQGADPAAARITARFERDYEKVEGRAEAIRVRLRADGSGWLATPTGPQGSHVLTSMLGADGLAFSATDATVVRAGEPIEVELLR